MDSSSYSSWSFALKGRKKKAVTAPWGADGCSKLGVPKSDLQTNSDFPVGVRLQPPTWGNGGMGRAAPNKDRPGNHPHQTKECFSRSGDEEAEMSVNGLQTSNVRSVNPLGR